MTWLNKIKMAKNSVKTDSENIISLLLVDINRPIDLEWKLLVTGENKASNFTADSLLKVNS